MSQEFNELAKAHVDRDVNGNVRNILHVEEFFRSQAPTPQLAAAEYLKSVAGLLDIKDGELRSLALGPEAAPTSHGVEFRLWSEKTQFDSTTITFCQTYWGVPIWEAGLSVQMLANPFRIVGAQSTAHHNVSAVAPTEAALRRLTGLNEEKLAAALGIAAKDPAFLTSTLKIERHRLFVLRYRADQRVRLVEDLAAHSAEPAEPSTHRHHYSNPPLPPVPERMKDGEHYVVAAVYFVLGVPGIPNLHWVALVEAETLSVLLLRAFVAGVDGLVFRHDPVTTNGGPQPNAGNAALNPLRSTVLLEKLSPPVGGNYALAGDIVQVVNVEPPPIAPPIEAVATDFNFNARTDNFAAVNAYYHSDGFFRLVQELGFDLNVYFGGTLFPTTVDHRGLGGAVLNAHCLGNGSFGILETSFALADLTNIAQPLGIACDQRVVLHELAGHGTLYNHVNGPNFGFAHSAGDSVGAVLNDPVSKAPDRYMSFPWLYSAVGRRHDRKPSAGWGWEGAIALNPFGPLDLGGYNNEQILSTTHFRIYRSIGGDSTELVQREFAGRYVAYLILRTIGGLTQPTNPPNALTYAAFLMSADLGNWTTAKQVGGCYWKVIRWAFEKQGLYQPAATPTPNNNIGAPPPIDVYIDDGRHGEYMYGPAGQFPYLQRFWENRDIWNRHEPDGHLEHQTPIVGRRNYAYVRVKNRGTSAVNNVIAHGWHCRPTAGLVWPDDWQPMTTPSRVIPHLSSGGEVVVGPFDWHPEHAGGECMFMNVTVAGDRANNDPASGLSAATGPTPLWRLVPCDNNLGLRALVLVPGGGGREALEAAFAKREFIASNPFSDTAAMEVRAVLSPFLASRGWTLQFDNPGGGSFSLGGRASRVIRPRLVPGADFTATEVQLAGEVNICAVVLADGLVVGGVTFELAPYLRHPAAEFPEPEHEHEHHLAPRHDHDRHEHHGGPRRIKIEVDVD